MELVTTLIQTEQKKGTVSAQVTFDETCNLQEHLPDIFAVILNRGEVRIDEAKAAKGHITVRGAVLFGVLYSTDQNEWKISSLGGELPFVETLNADGVNEFDTIRVSPVLEDLSIQVIHSRKLGIRALLELRVSAGERIDVAVPCGFADEENIQTLKNPAEYLRITYQGKEQCRVREEIRIPSTKPNIGQILWQQAQPFQTGVRVADSGLSVQGEIRILLIYVGEETGTLEWFVEKIPFQCRYEIPEAGEKAVPYVPVRIQNVKLEVAEDEDGERRIIQAEADLQAEVRLLEEQSVTVLDDAYALDRTLTPVKSPVCLSELLMRNESGCQVNETLRIQNPDTDILQICAGFGTAELDRETMTEEGLLAEGAVHVQILCLTSNDNAPVEAVEADLSFRHLIPVPEHKTEVETELYYDLSDLSFLMKSGKEAEVHAAVTFHTLVTAPVHTEMISEVGEKEEDSSSISSLPSMTGLILTEEDSLWEVAKQYHTTVSQIRSSNPIDETRGLEGQKILLIKQIS